MLLGDSDMLFKAVYSLIRNLSVVSASVLPLCDPAAHRSAHRSAHRRFPAIAGAPSMRLQSTRLLSYMCQGTQAHIASQLYPTETILCNFFYTNL